MASSVPILAIRDLRAHFHTRRGIIKAVDGISFEIQKGETLAIVGESGSGKTVSQLSYLGLLPMPPLRIAGGQAFFHDTDLIKAGKDKLRAVRGDSISMIFQEPMTSLNPYLKIGTQLIEPLCLHRKLSKKEAWKVASESLEKVGIADAARTMHSYPHEFSGGMRQRVMIAMAITTKPEVLIADEPTTALDVTIQAQILELLGELKKETGMSIILITHDLGIVASVADKVLVMYGGKMMEEATAHELFSASSHPYTTALLKSTPRVDIPQEVLPVIGGSPPDLSKLSPGCPFYDRCALRLDACKETAPKPCSLSPSHRSFCHLETVQ
ncbi:MAG: ABC transporter ATP-binding protein [Deltaproteobacteria bacterium]|nr:ABC transporter ATP-binding protein [Deltaproteobacteria bacterium]